MAEILHHLGCQKKSVHNIVGFQLPTSNLVFSPDFWTINRGGFELDPLESKAPNHLPVHRNVESIINLNSWKAGRTVEGPKRHQSQLYPFFPCEFVEGIRPNPPNPMPPPHLPTNHPLIIVGTLIIVGCHHLIKLLTHLWSPLFGTKAHSSLSFPRLPTWPWPSHVAQLKGPDFEETSRCDPRNSCHLHLGSKEAEQ